MKFQQMQRINNRMLFDYLKRMPLIKKLSKLLKILIVVSCLILLKMKILFY